MRIFGIGVSIALLAAASLPAQNRGSSDPTPRMTGSFGSVVFPGGTAAQGVQRSKASVVFPGGGGPRLVIPGTITDPSFALGVGSTIRGSGNSWQSGRARSTPIYAYPVYVGGYGYYDSYGYQAPPAPSQPQNITVIYPPQQQQPAPVVMSPYEAPSSGSSEFRLYQTPAPASPPASQASAPEEQRLYLLAFKDSTVYAAVAYWVDGETVHYFTSGNKHNQASLSLIDREMTARLNREAGSEVKLP